MTEAEIERYERRLNQYLIETEDRLNEMETCLDQLAMKLRRASQSELVDARVMKGLLDQTRMITSTIRGYDKIIEMRLNMEAHRQANKRYIDKLRQEQAEEETENQDQPHPEQPPHGGVSKGEEERESTNSSRHPRGGGEGAEAKRRRRGDDEPDTPLTQASHPPDLAQLKARLNGTACSANAPPR